MSKNKKKNFFKTFACFSLVALSTSSMVLAAKNSQDFTNVISFGDSFVDGGAVKTYANTLAEKNASNHLLQKIGFQFLEAYIDIEDGTVWEWRLERTALG